jgi:hypothetical protein
VRRRTGGHRWFGFGICSSRTCCCRPSCSRTSSFRQGDQNQQGCQDLCFYMLSDTRQS